MSFLKKSPGPEKKPGPEIFCDGKPVELDLSDEEREFLSKFLKVEFDGSIVKLSATFESFRTGTGVMGRGEGELFGSIREKLLAKRKEQESAESENTG